MYKNKKVLAFIPARKGSKRLPNKNNLLLNNIPLFVHSINIAKSSKYIDEIIVSSDSNEILDVAHNLGCIKNKLRPEKLSDDKARIIDAILYEKEVNNLYEFDAIVLLQPTFPIRTIEMLDGAIVKYFEKEESLITVVKSLEQPVFMRQIKNGLLHKIISDSSDIRSQDFKEIYKIVGNIYINNLKKINNETILNENLVPYEIERKYCIDIDTYEDFKQAEREMEK